MEWSLTKLNEVNGGSQSWLRKHYALAACAGQARGGTCIIVVTRLRAQLHKLVLKQLSGGPSVGLLNHACKVVRSGRSFLRRMIDLLHSMPHPPHKRVPIRLNTGFRSDLLWWSEFVSRWNGISFLPTSPHLPVVEMATDASGTWGCGAWHQDSWFQVHWDSRSQDLPIAAKELIPIILGCGAWGQSWRGLQVHCHCDNQAVVACLRSRTSKNKGIMHMLRCLVFIEAHFQFHIHPM